MDPKQYLDAITYASNQNDRWMFIALLAIGVLFVIVLIRYAGKKFDDLQRRIDIREEKFEVQNKEFVTHLKQNNKELLEVISAAHQTITRNSLLMERIEKKLDAL